MNEEQKEQFKIAQISEKLREINDILGITETTSNENTPNRIAKMWVNELFPHIDNKGIHELKNSMTTFPNKYMNDHIIVRDIPFSSMCEHHWLPFSGTVSVGYIPCADIIGLSKIPRVVRYFSKKPQLQEKLGHEICNFLNEILCPEAILVVVKAKHQCVACRGAEVDCETVTTMYLGNYEDMESLRKVMGA